MARALTLSMVLLAGAGGCFVAAPFDPPGAEIGRQTHSDAMDDPADDPADDSDGAPADDPADDPADPGGDPAPAQDDPATDPADEALCGRYCAAREACRPGDGDALCTATCLCFVGVVIRQDWVESVGECAVAVECDGGDPFPVCAAERGAQGGVTPTAQAAYDSCAALEASLGCPGWLDCPTLLSMTDEAAAAVMPCTSEPTCGAARDCAESALFAQCLR